MRAVRRLLLASTCLMAPVASSFAQIDLAPANQRAIPFTTYSHEQRAALDTLRCAWRSDDVRYADGRADFLCVGGTWATVELMFDRSHRVGDGLARVRLLWREWPSDHPASTESYVAQAYLAYVADHFVPVKLSHEVMQAFWQPRTREWQMHHDLRITYTDTDSGGYRLHKLVVEGLSDKLTLPTTPPQPPLRAYTAPQVEAPRTPSHVQQPPQVIPQPPADRPPVALPPARHRPPSSPLPSQSQAPKAPPPPPNAPLPATPADIPAQAQPIEKQRPAPPPPENLVPDARQRGGGTPAPTNFSIYNKAEQLTRDTELKAFGKAAPPKALPGTAPKAAPASQEPVKSGGLILPPGSVAPLPTPPTKGQGPAVLPVIPLPVPAVSATTTPPSPTVAEGEGLGNPSAPAAPYTPVGNGSGGARPLPQLKFIPRAQPLGPADEVIHFEDEKSKL
jgi:hypothetical protein